jgi:putative (di)nucleoside polyphosphate hydrolase
MGTAYFRANAAAFIHDGAGNVLLFHCVPGSDVPEEGWQFPQGGIEEGETPGEAVLREVEEEAGLSRARFTVEKEAGEWICYGHDHSSQPGLLGQAQKWFLVRVAPGTVAVPDQREFASSRWFPRNELLDIVPAYRRPIYAAALRALAQ